MNYLKILLSIVNFIMSSSINSLFEIYSTISFNIFLIILLNIVFDYLRIYKFNKLRSEANLVF